MSESTPTRRCPECGATLPIAAPDERPCPACLMRLGMESWEARGADQRPEDSPTTPWRSSFEPPPPEELAKSFPNLEILELLGQGGMGAVYKARQPHLDRVVALKILPPELGSDPAFEERFAREAKALAKFSRPNIVTLYDFGRVSSGVYYLLMEFVDGVNLRQLMRERQLEPAEALAIVPQICDALQFAHDQGIVHRDIKPENILVDRSGRVKIADFGLAKIIGKPVADVSLTDTQQVVGTVHYMAPEQTRGSRAVDHRADIYSLGVVFYEMLTGELPVGRFEAPSKKVQVNIRLDEIVLRALENEPDRRYQHASEMKSDVASMSHAALPVPTAPLNNRTTTDDVDVDAVRKWVQWTAIGVLSLGTVSLVLSLVWGLEWVAKLPLRGTNPYAALVLVVLLISLPLAMIVGGARMALATSDRTARAASIVVLLLALSGLLWPIVGPTPPFLSVGAMWIISLTLAAWLVVVLSKPDVMQGFARRKKSGDRNQSD